MPASTVTVRAAGSRAMTLSIERSESRLNLLSAMLLKQCRVPSTLRWLCFLTKSRACSSELAEYRFSVLYSRLPAQFFNLSPAILPSFAHANRADSNREGTNGVGSIADESFRKVRLSMADSEMAAILHLIWGRHVWCGTDTLVRRF